MLSVTFGRMDEVRNRTMNNEVCKQGNKEIKAKDQDTQFSTDGMCSERGLVGVVGGRDSGLKVQGT